MTNYLSLPKNSSEYVIITTNGIIKNSGQAVMGAGLAKLASDTYPRLSRELAKYLKDHGNRCFIFHKYNLIAFPTKHHYKDKSDVLLIEKSLSELKSMIEKFGIKKVYMPRIGCGLGGLYWPDVKMKIEHTLKEEIRSGIIVYAEP
jgi:hypothetical protein